MNIGKKKCREELKMYTIDILAIHHHFIDGRVLSEVAQLFLLTRTEQKFRNILTWFFLNKAWHPHHIVLVLAMQELISKITNMREPIQKPGQGDEDAQCIIPFYLYSNIQQKRCVGIIIKIIEDDILPNWYISSSKSPERKNKLYE